MKRCFLKLTAMASLVVCWGITSEAYAEMELWYNGDFNGDTGLVNQRNMSVKDARVYDDFIVPASGWRIDTVWSNNLMDPGLSITQAHWEIRSGVSSGNGGNLLFSGDSPATLQLTGRSLASLHEYTIQVTGLNIDLGAGTYWLSVVPIGSGEGRSYVSTTSGKNATGSPPGNDRNAFIDSREFSATFDPTYPRFGDSDFSMGVAGSASVVATPEPASLILIGAGALCVGGVAWRRRSQNT